MFGGGGGGFDPRKMEQMMKQMGIESEDLDATEVVIRTPDEELVFADADVTKIQAQGQETYQIVGEPETREAGSGADAGEDAAIEDADIPADDVEIVTMRTGASEDDAREALREADGDLATAVEKLEAEPK
ncbi:nascent polypeptide-associated complex protein [Halalkalicoccus jeotgali]|uniref:Nascent polypeptide-associated complex protein n=1 Tax=Halalkalicoccus jeotgali (strain DSM 18796 / CECT 7217 / JCM 14584 / KCTC 4019 / B3) TaxID=795797 RepID=D8J8A4_HALJB|nr:nascent polypeptide-associated complex protein [Halalkalicoccus jeotgali]ADJ16150.1 nascent polypeptide-associated complex protein [Halalkalicoccus jeotgali B3]ELY37579.1 nascent polypeptide-associated complex protein [Halalkalicoccus jeotgali B3]